jgi:hypothetical protein
MKTSLEKVGVDSSWHLHLGIVHSLKRQDSLLGDSVFVESGSKRRLASALLKLPHSHSPLSANV